MCCTPPHLNVVCNCTNHSHYKRNTLLYNSGIQTKFFRVLSVMKVATRCLPNRTNKMAKLVVIPLIIDSSSTKIKSTQDIVHLFAVGYIYILPTRVGSNRKLQRILIVAAGWLQERLQPLLDSRVQLLGHTRTTDDSIHTFLQTKFTSWLFYIRLKARSLNVE